MRQHSKMAFIFLWIFLSLVVSSAILAQGEESEGRQLGRAIFEYNGQIYLYDEKVRIVKQITSGEPKYLPVISPDRNLLAFAYSRFHTDNLSLQFGIMDLRTEKLKNITLPEHGLDMITGFDWFNTQVVGIDCHINPYLAEYFIFDIEKGNLLKKYTGNLFIVLPDRKSILYKVPVLDEEEHSQVEMLYIDDSMIYKSDNTAYRIGFPQVSSNQKKLVFFERNANDDTKNYLVIADLNVTKKKTSNIKRILLTKEVRGVVYFDEANNVYLINQESTFKANLQTKTFAQVAPINLTDNDEVLRKKTEILNNTLNHYFRIEKTNRVVISNLQWF